MEREAGTTEDGVERQKLMITAIIEEGQGQCRGRTKDLAQGYKAESAGMVRTFEAILLAMARPAYLPGI